MNSDKSRDLVRIDELNINNTLINTIVSDDEDINMLKYPKGSIKLKENIKY